MGFVHSWVLALVLAMAQSRGAWGSNLCSPYMIEQDLEGVSRTLTDLPSVSRRPCTDLPTCSSFQSGPHALSHHDACPSPIPPCVSESLHSLCMHLPTKVLNPGEFTPALNLTHPRQALNLGHPRQALIHRPPQAAMRASRSRYYRLSRRWRRPRTAPAPKVPKYLAPLSTHVARGKRPRFSPTQLSLPLLTYRLLNGTRRRCAVIGCQLWL